MPAPQKNAQGHYDVLSFPPGTLHDPYDMVPFVMVAAHNMMIRGFNSMAYYAPRIKENEVPGFSRYCMAVLQTIHHHHKAEEELMFPFLESKIGEGSMGGNVDGHHEFLPDLEAFEKYCTSIHAGSVKFEAKVFLEKMDKFTPALIEHLTDEIPTLDAERLRTHITLDELASYEKRLQEMIMKETSLVYAFPQAIVNNDKISAAWFLPVPWIVIFALKWLVMPWYSHIWKYGASWDQTLKPEFSSLTTKPPSSKPQ
ncbi:hypothetical protein DL96DRAFT_1704575 [Flagelloscypha sp. PMI_526]|nr:hypothetical protein DL96DRAFT_1704575 [Flagelloscypha sp. PMI_526]